MLRQIIASVISGLILALLGFIAKKVTSKHENVSWWIMIVAFCVGVVITTLIYPFFISTSPTWISITSSPPSGKLHIFNGDKADAERSALQTKVPITKDPRTVFGTKENLPIAVADLSTGNIPAEGFLRVNGIYEIYSDDIGGGLPSMFLALTGKDNFYKTIPITIENKLRVASNFSIETSYRLDQINKAGLYVNHAGSWGFFLNQIKFEVRKK